MSENKEDLLLKFIEQSKENKAEHDMAAKLGSLGVSPAHMIKYNESIKKIKEYESKNI